MRKDPAPTPERTVASGCCPSVVTTCWSPPRCVKARLWPVRLLLLPLPPRESTAVSEATAEACAAEDPLPVVGVGTGDGSDATAVPAVAASDAIAAPIEASARDALVPPPASVLVGTAWLLADSGEGASGAASTSGGSAASGSCERSNDAAESAAVDAIPTVAPGRPESSESDGRLGPPASAAAAVAGGGLGCRRGRRLKPESTSALPCRPPASSSPSL